MHLLLWLHLTIKKSTLAKTQSSAFCQNKLEGLVRSSEFSPSLPQPPTGQSLECVCCQSPDPVIESKAQVKSVSHRPQQQLPMLRKRHSSSPGKVQGWPGVGKIGKEQTDPEYKRFLTNRKARLNRLQKRISPAIMCTQIYLSHSYVVFIFILIVDTHLVSLQSS